MLLYHAVTGKSRTPRQPPPSPEHTGTLTHRQTRKHEFAGTASAEWCHPDRYQPEDEAGDAGEDQADDGVLRAEGAEGEHTGEGKNQAHVNDGSTQRGSLQWAIWRVAGFPSRLSRTV